MSHWADTFSLVSYQSVLSSVLRNVVNINFKLLLSDYVICKNKAAGFGFWELMALLFCFCVLLSGYSPTIKGQLLHVDTTSSMQYRTLLEAEMLAVRSKRLHKNHFSWLFGRNLKRTSAFYFPQCTKIKSWASEMSIMSIMHIMYILCALIKVKMWFVSGFISVSCDSQLPSGVEHASVLAVWDWGV